MKVVIVGASYTGIQLARSLADEKSDVVLIDNSPEKVRLARNKIDCTVIQAAGNDLQVLERDAGISSADALVMLTEDDETNMITCSLVDMRHPKLRKIARVRNEAYYAACAAGKAPEGRDAPLPFGIGVMLNPDVEAANAVQRAVAHGAIGNIVDLGGGFCITEFRVQPSSALVGMRMKDVGAMAGWSGLAAYIEDAAGALLPNGETQLKADDRIGIVSSSADVGELSRLMSGKDLSVPRRIVVFGAGRTGTLIVEKLLAPRPAAGLLQAFKAWLSPGSEIFLVDSDETLCREAKERFRGIRVLCGDISDKDFIRDEGLDSCDLMIAVSPGYDRNLVAAAYLKSLGVRKTIALTESQEFDDVARKLGIDVAVPMRSTIVDAMTGHLRGAGTASVHTVCDGRFEIVSCDVSAQGEIAGRRLCDMSMKGECLVLLVRHAGEGAFTVPHGEYEVLAGDRVVFIARAGDRRLDAMFGSGRTA